MFCCSIKFYSSLSIRQLLLNDFVICFLLYNFAAELYVFFLDFWKKNDVKICLFACSFTSLCSVVLVWKI